MVYRAFMRVNSQSADVMLNHCIVDILHGHPLIDSVKSGWCMQATRLIVESAFGWRDMEFYDHYGAARTTGVPWEHRVDRSWWAADIEASMKRLGMAIPVEDRQVGDLVFSHELAKPVGHVGIVAPNDMILEVTNPARRPKSWSRGTAVCLTPFGWWKPTLVARLRLPEQE